MNSFWPWAFWVFFFAIGTGANIGFALHDVRTQSYSYLTAVNAVAGAACLYCWVRHTIRGCSQ